MCGTEVHRMQVNSSKKIQNKGVECDGAYTYTSLFGFQ